MRNKSTEKIPGPPRIGTQDLLKIVRPLLPLRLLDPCGKTSYILVLSSIALGSDSISIKRKKWTAGRPGNKAIPRRFILLSNGLGTRLDSRQHDVNTGGRKALITHHTVALSYPGHSLQRAWVQGYHNWGSVLDSDFLAG